MSDLPVTQNAPPAEYLEQTTAMISKAVSQLGVDEKGALTWIASKKGDQISVNLAVVAKVNEHVTVLGWLGKEHGEPIAAGIAGKIVW
jgi:hypothetical protein